MIDIQLVRDNPELVKEKVKQKGYSVDIDKFLNLDSDRKELLQKVEDFRKQRNEIAAQMKGGKPEQNLIDQGKEIKIQLAEQEQYLEKTDLEWKTLLESIPNLHFDDVPVGGEDAFVEIESSGAVEGSAEDHLSFALNKNWIDFDRGAKVAGAKFYFLKGDLALLEMALTQFVTNFVVSKGFLFMTVPNMVNSKTATGTGFAPRSSEQSDEYYIENEDLSLIATAEMPLTGYYAGEVLDEKELPIFMLGYSPCYRKEAGTYGKHNRGLFRVHQFNKLEMYAFCTESQSEKIHEQLLTIEKEIWDSLGVPYRVINIPSGDLGAPAAKKYDIEYWSKADGEYRELTSCSNCTDFQTRNLNIKYRTKDGSLRYAHSLNGTAASLARTLIAIIENYQTDDGNLRVPEVLKPYLNGREIL